jgi:hypothetical protein
VNWLKTSVRWPSATRSATCSSIASSLVEATFACRGSTGATSRLACRLCPLRPVQTTHGNSRRAGPDSPDAVAFRRAYAVSDETPIRFIGVWDTVGSLGVPNVTPR